MPRKPIDQLGAGQRFYARHFPDLDVEYFGALWHLFTAGHLVATDLDSVTRQLGYSFADLDLLGTLAVDENRRLRATDLASALYVSEAVISTRIARLEKEGLLERGRSATDRRAFELQLTDKGRAALAKAIDLIERNAKIVRFFRSLGPQDRAHLLRLLGMIHQMYDREFAGTAYFPNDDAADGVKG